MLLFRLIRPEQLARPEGFRNLLDFLAVLQAPTSPFLPSEWAADMIMNWLLRIGDPLPILLLWTTAARSSCSGALLHRRLYLTGSRRRRRAPSTSCAAGAGARARADPARTALPVAKREFVLKDLRLFFRDTTQWSQLILLAVLLVVYVFNIRPCRSSRASRCPVLLRHPGGVPEPGPRRVRARGHRGAVHLPAVSLEGRQLWLLRSSPLDLARHALEQVLGRHGAAAGPGAAHHRRHQRAAPGVAPS